MNIEISLTSVIHTPQNKWSFFLHCREREVETQRVLWGFFSDFNCVPLISHLSLLRVMGNKPRFPFTDKEVEVQNLKWWQWYRARKLWWQGMTQETGGHTGCWVSGQGHGWQVAEQGCLISNSMPFTPSFAANPGNSLLIVGRRKPSWPPRSSTSTHPSSCLLTGFSAS